MTDDGAMPAEGPPGRPGGLDAIGWYIATTHETLGHDKAAAVLGQAPGDREACLICIYERERTPEAKAAVIAALGPGGITVLDDPPDDDEVPPEGHAR